MYHLSLALFSVAVVTRASRVLLVSSPITSHFLEQRDLGVSLAARGHEVWLALEARYPRTRLVAPPPLRVVNFRVPDDAVQLCSDASLDELLSMALEDPVKVGREFFERSQERCAYMMRDAEFIARLQRLHFDIVIVNGFMFGLCNFLVPYRLRVPFVDFFNAPKHWDARVPVFPSVVPHRRTFFGERMTFRERLSNLMAHVTTEFTDYSMFRADTSLLRRYATQFRTWTELKRQAVLFVSTTDYILGVRQPSLPNTIHVTSLSARPAQPLPAHFEKIVSTATDHGVIVMSLGSMTRKIPKIILNKFFDAFSKLPLTVVLKYENENSTSATQVAKNIHMLPWIPQNDIIGHERTVLFITHCGNGGLSEAVYHGVPMIAFPLFAEQQQNAARMVQRGFGVTLDIKHFTAAELASAISEVLHNATYRSAVGRASAILKDRPMNSLQTVTFWVEHVMKFGGAHLRSHGQDMAAYEFFMIDIAAFLLALVIVVTFLLNKIARLAYSLISGGKEGKEKAE